jgi:amino acid transporter
VFTLTHGLLSWRTDGSIDEPFWSIFEFKSIVSLLPYVAMSLAFLKLRHADPTSHRPHEVPGGRAGAWIAALLCVALLVLAVVFFVVDPFDLSVFDAPTFWLVVGGLAVTFVVQEGFVWRSPRWKARLREHPELGAQVQLDGFAPDDASWLDGDALPPAPDEPAGRVGDGPESTDRTSQPPTRA